MIFDICSQRLICKPIVNRYSENEISPDAERPGALLRFTKEQVCHLVHIVCKSPEEHYGRPISHWTPRELADELAKFHFVCKFKSSHASFDGENQVKIMLQKLLELFLLKISNLMVKTVISVPQKVKGKHVAKTATLDRLFHFNYLVIRRLKSPMFNLKVTH